MPDPTLKKSLDELAAVLSRLNEESESLNARIEELETTLIQLNPGASVWLGQPICLDADGSNGSQLGFGKPAEQWGLWIIRAKFGKSSSGEWRMIGSGKVIRLAEATRDERIAAVSVFPSLVGALTSEAKARLATIEAANKRAQ